jgi:hypothetical protein
MARSLASVSKVRGWAFLSLDRNRYNLRRK